MVEPDVIDTGVAVAQSTLKGVQHYYGVQMFARPRSASVEFEVSNPTGESVTYHVGDRLYILHARTSRTHTECAAQQLTIDLKGVSDSRFTTRKGDKFVVARDKGQLSVRRE